MPPLKAAFFYPCHNTALTYLSTMMFNEVIGQPFIKERLREMVSRQRLSHALLFLGREGNGALPLARAFSQYLVCEKNKPSSKQESRGLFGEVTSSHSKSDWQPDSCGICPSCVKTAQMIHPDIHYSFPVIPKKTGDKPISTDYIREWREFMMQFPYGNTFDWLQFIGAENKQGNITSDECNDIIRKLNLKSFERSYKILLMWMPEYLGKEGNKLLKLIEEPPDNTLFILVAEDEDRILPTIISRTQLVRVPALTPNEIEIALGERAGATPEQSRRIAAVADGNYREALAQLQHAESDWQAVIRDWLNATLKINPLAQVKWVEEISKAGREKQKQFLRYFNHLLEQSIHLRTLGPDSLHVPENELDFALRLNKLTSLAQQKAIIEELDRASYHIERNANPKMLFQALTIKLYHIISDNSLILMN
jgi:DNA polymerase-3 subunit delta'